MLGEEARERGDVRAVGSHRNGERLRPTGSQERMEVEIAGVVDHYRVAGVEQEAADEVERLRTGIGDDDLVGIDQHGPFGEPHREEPAQRREAERLVVLSPPLRVVARREPQGPLDAEVEHPGIGQPAGARAEEVRQPQSSRAG